VVDFLDLKQHEFVFVELEITLPVILCHTYIETHSLKIQGRGYLMFLLKSQGGSRVSGENSQAGGGSPYFGVYCIFINKCIKVCLRGVLYLPLPPPHPPAPPRVHQCIPTYFKNVLGFRPTKAEPRKIKQKKT
jgi:hypothetical protein